MKEVIHNLHLQQIKRLDALENKYFIILNILLQGSFTDLRNSKQMVSIQIGSLFFNGTVFLKRNVDAQNPQRD